MYVNRGALRYIQGKPGWTRYHRKTTTARTHSPLHFPSPDRLRSWLEGAFVQKQAVMLDQTRHAIFKRRSSPQPLTWDTVWRSKPMQSSWVAPGVYKQSKDYTREGAITSYPKLGVDVFEKTSKSRMRFALAARAMGSTMASCIRSITSSSC